MQRYKPSLVAGIIPLVDVLLVLVVVLMLLPSFVKRMPVQLPQTSFSAVPVAVSSVKVFLNEKGQVFLDDRLVPLEAVLAKVAPGVTVELGADENVKYAVLMQVMAEIQNRNPREIALMTF